MTDEESIKKALDEYYQHMHEYEERLFKNTERVFKAIRSVLGLRFLICLKYLLYDDGGTVIHGFSFTDSPSGEIQDVGRGVIRKYWVDQYSVGMEGDSWEGTIYFQLKEKKYIAFNYSC